MIIGLTNNSNLYTQRKSSPGLSRGAFERIPKRDEVCFGSLDVNEVLPKIKRYSAYENILPSHLSPTKVQERYADGDLGDYENAFLVKSSSSDSRGLDLVCSRGHFWGNIQGLDYKDHESSKYPVGKYLRLKNLYVPFTEPYKGVGTALVRGAQEESMKNGLGGQLKVCAYNIFDEDRGSPVPFYAKLGFVSAESPHMTKDELIETYSKPEAIYHPLTMFLLTPPNLERLKEFHDTKKAPLQ